MALHTGLRYRQRLAGILALSCYIPLAGTLATERQAVNQHTPLFIAHGDYDAVIPMRYGQQSAEALQSLGYAVDWNDYGMGHEAALLRTIRRSNGRTPVAARTAQAGNRSTLRSRSS